MAEQRITVQADLDVHDIAVLVRAYADQAQLAASGADVPWSIEDAVSRLVLAMAWRDQLKMKYPIE